jgi:hypothetical protein
MEYGVVRFLAGGDQGQSIAVAVKIESGTRSLVKTDFLCRAVR